MAFKETGVFTDGNRHTLEVGSWDGQIEIRLYTEAAPEKGQNFLLEPAHLDDVINALKKAKAAVS